MRSKQGTQVIIPTETEIIHLLQLQDFRHIEMMGWDKCFFLLSEWKSWVGKTVWMI